jgi:hypothetical protein
MTYVHMFLRRNLFVNTSEICLFLEVGEYIYSPIRLHGEVLNLLNTGQLYLCRIRYL